MLIAILFAVACVLVAFAGLMAALDAAISVQSSADMSELAAAARTQRSLGAIAEDPGAHLNVINFVRIVAETTAAVLVTLAFTSIFDQFWLTLVVTAAIMTGVSFVLVGTSPRSVGRVRSATILRLGAPLVHVLRMMLGPVAHALVALGNRVTPSRARSARVASEEQLLSIVDEATDLDVLEEDDRELIHSIFEFNDTVVREVMIPRTDMVTIDESASVGTGMGLFLSTGVSRMPVIAGEVDDVVGILYLRDVAKLTYERPVGADAITVRELARPALFVPESKKADDLLRQMQVESNHMAMVVDEYGGIAGLVALEDLIEELVGDIFDEYDREVALVEPLSDGRYRVSARMPVDDVGKLFGIELDDEDVDSVGGLLAKLLDRLPVPGAAVRASGLIFTADRTEGRRKRLSTVLVEPDTTLIDTENALSEGTEQ